MGKKLFTTQNLVTISLLAGIAYVVMLFGRIPMPLVSGIDLKYDPKDIVIVMSGFLFGPLPMILISAVVSFIEMFTVSETGWIGLIMNIVSTCSFSLPAAIIYKSRHSIKRAVIGLIIGCIFMVTVMLLWNYFLVPLYLGVPRDVVVGMLTPVFLPFNLIKGGLNAALAMLLYKPLSNILRKINLMPKYDSSVEKGKVKISVILVSGFVIITGVLFILVIQGKI
ncbi:MAG: ECF transporter S component [Eubacterium sp.]|jgi:riboflavin transporter FmnP|nr:ECF transporter S component [Eubacterium sp.]